MNERRSDKDQKVVLTNISAERIVLGKVLANSKLFWDINGILMSMHFSRAIFREIYEAVYRLNMDGKPFSLRAMQAMVGAEYEDGQSTMTLMTAMIREVEEIDDINGFLAEIIDLWRRRRTIEVAQQFIAEAQKASTDTAYMLTDLENCVKDITAHSSEEPLRTIGTYAGAVLSNAKAAETGKRRVGIDFMLPSLSQMVGKMHAGDLGYVLAPQGHGKTVVAWHILKASAQQGVPSCLFQLEMTGENMAGRALAGETGVSVEAIDEATYDAFEWSQLVEARERLDGLPVYIDARPLLSVEKIRERAIALKRTKGIGLIAIDHMRLVQTMKRFHNKFDRVEYVSSYLKALAKDLEITVVGLSQVTRQSQRRDDPVPRISDSDLGSAVEQDADWAISAFRRDAWLTEHEPLNRSTNEWAEWNDEIRKYLNTIDIRCLKRRRGRAGMGARFYFDGPRYRIEEIEK